VIKCVIARPAFLPVAIASACAPKVRRVSNLPSPKDRLQEGMDVLDKALEITDKAAAQK
jgi:hypothetical protein